jgi:hypothetical protein
MAADLRYAVDFFISDKPDHPSRPNVQRQKIQAVRVNLMSDQVCREGEKYVAVTVPKGHLCLNVYNTLVPM